MGFRSIWVPEKHENTWIWAEFTRRVRYQP